MTGNFFLIHYTQEKNFLVMEGIQLKNNLFQGLDNKPYIRDSSQLLASYRRENSNDLYGSFWDDLPPAARNMRDGFNKDIERITKRVYESDEYKEDVRRIVERNMTHRSVPSLHNMLGQTTLHQDMLKAASESLHPRLRGEHRREHVGEWLQTNYRKY